MVETDDGSGHDGQGDATAQAPEGNLCNCTSRENYVKVGEDVVLASKTGDKVESRQPQEQYSTCNRLKTKLHVDAETQCNEIIVARTRGHLDTREAVVGECQLLEVHFRFEELAQLPPVSAMVQRQLKGFVNLLDFLISLY